MDIERKKKFILNIIYWILVLALFYVALKYFINLIMPFFIAVILAALSRPLAKLLASPNKKIRTSEGGEYVVPRSVRITEKFAAIISVFLLFLVIFGLITLICVRIVDSGVDLVEKIPSVYYESVAPALETLLDRAEAWASRIDDSVLAMVESSAANIVGTIGSKVTELSGRLILAISSIAGKLPGFLLNMIICLIATVFIAVDIDGITGFFKRNLPEKTLTVVTEFKDSLVDIVWQFIKSYFLIFVITTAEITVGFLIIGQPRPLLLGMLIAVFDAFPIVGSGMILLPFSIITMASGMLGRGIGLLIVYLVVVIVRQIIEPKIVGKRVGLKPIVTLVCMYVGTKLFGGIGLFAVPILAAIINDMNSDGTIHLFKVSEEADVSIPEENREAPEADARPVEQERNDDMNGDGAPEDNN